MTADLERSAPKVYLDTNVLLDLFYNRRRATTELVVQGRNEQWELASSHFAMTELYDIIQERTWAVRRLNEENEQLNSVIAGRHQRDLPSDTLLRIQTQVTHFTDVLHSELVFYDFAGTGSLNAAMAFSAHTNLSAPDCIHLTLAIEIGADLIVTSDRHFITQAESYVPTSRPEDAVPRLRDMWFNV